MSKIVVVVKMGRVERKKIEKGNRRKKRYKSILILLIVFLCVSGILIVDNTLRVRLMMEKRNIVEYEKIAGNIHRISFFGKQLDIHEEILRGIPTYVKKEMKYFIEKTNSILYKNKKTNKDSSNINRATSSVI